MINEVKVSSRNHGQHIEITTTPKKTNSELKNKVTKIFQDALIEFGLNIIKNSKALRKMGVEATEENVRGIIQEVGQNILEEEELKEQTLQKLLPDNHPNKIKHCNCEQYRKDHRIPHGCKSRASEFCPLHK